MAIDRSGRRLDPGRPDGGGRLADRLPEREPADEQVAVGVVAGLGAGTAMWLVAMVAARGDLGFTAPLRLVAASLLGEAALDTGATFGPPALGALLVALGSVLFGLVYASILPEGAEAFGAALLGAAYAVAVWALTWFVLTRVLDPILFASTGAAHMLALHLVYGVILGALVPTLRRVLP